MYKEVLIVVNSVNYSSKSVREATRISKIEQASLHILFYRPTDLDLYDEVPTAFSESIYLPYEYKGIQELNTEFNASINDFIDKLKSENITNVSSAITYTEPKKSVPKYANENKIDLIVIGETDELFAKLDIESVSKAIIKHTSSALLILR